MTEGSDRGHRVVQVHVCKKYHKTGAGGVRLGGFC